MNEDLTSQTIHALLVGVSKDESRRIRELVRETSSTQFEWNSVERLSTAKDVLRSELFDLVVLELFLPDSQGLDTFIRLHPHAVCLPVVVLTNLDNEALAIRALRDGAQDYLIKERMAGEPPARAFLSAIVRKHREMLLQTKIDEMTAGVRQELITSLALIKQQVEELQQNLERKEHPIALRTLQREINHISRLLPDILQLRGGGLLSIPSSDRNAQEIGMFDLAQYFRDHQMVKIEDDNVYLGKGLAPGSMGFAIPGAVLNELLTTMHLLLQHGMSIPSTLDSLELNDSSRQASRVPSKVLISARERQVVQLVAKGWTNKEIAKQLSVSIRTVERLRSRVMNKLGLRNHAELLAYALQQGMLKRNNKTERNNRR